MATIRVVAVKGRLYPRPGSPGEFIGLKRAPKDALEADIVHRVPDGNAYVSAGTVEVPDVRDMRMAILRGDLARATEAEVQTSPAIPAPRRAPKEG